MGAQEGTRAPCWPSGMKSEVFFTLWVGWFCMVAVAAGTSHPAYGPLVTWGTGPQGGAYQS